MNVKRQHFLRLIAGLLLVALPVHAAEVVVLVENMAPENGVFLAPLWVGFHNGAFDLFDAGKPIPAGGAFERLVEDGDPEALQLMFSAAVPGGAGGFVAAPEGFPDVPVFEPGERASTTFELDPTQNRYMSFAAMILPSNDAFIANDNPQAIELFDAAGKFKGKQVITIFGADVWDAGTELNNEQDAAFLDQGEPGAGVSTAEPVKLHPGFIGSYNDRGINVTPIILGAHLGDDAYFDRIAADFTQPNAVVAQITIIPEPATAVFLIAGGLALLRKRHQQWTLPRRSRPR